MAIIYTYPKKSNPTGDDLVLLSDSGDKKTKQASILDFPIVTSFSTGTTGLEPSAETTGKIELKGILNIYHSYRS